GGQRLSPLQPLDDVRIAGSAELAGIPLAADQKRILVDPSDALLALGKDEAVVDEFVRPEVELADRDRVLATVGEVDQAAVFRWTHAIGALPHPVRLLRCRERVEVEHGFPVRMPARIIVDAGAPPDSADVVRVLPEIVDLAADKVARRNAILGLGDLQRL